MIAFGPVPSRRLGQSMGINNIPPKICTYSCVYCQIGKTLNMQVERMEFYKPDEIFQAVEKKVKGAVKKSEAVDYLTFVPDGEPTLDINIGKEIELFKNLGLKIAIITNSSLLWDKDVRSDCYKTDWISVKIDALTRDIWRKIDRPHGSLRLEKILDGLLEFAGRFKGELTTETMLIQGINDNMEQIEKISDFIAELKPTRSYIAIPTRPPAEKWVKPPAENMINMAVQIFKEKEIPTEYLIGYEGNAFAFTGNVEEDLLSITSVHPMREDQVREFLDKAEKDWTVIQKLISQEKLIESEYKDKKFYTRKLHWRE
ncbi:MAG: radical SAM protein [Candidatus Aminicenantes bacterium]|nr:radical SAM protein [Candidatus Aminicenantes bacterium]